MRCNLLAQKLTTSPLLTLNSNSILCFFPSHHLLRLRSRKHSVSQRDDADDPPFSRVPKASEPKFQLPTRTLSSCKGKSHSPFHSELPFDFRFSYSETDPSVRPIGFREPPRFSPFGPGRLDRKWDGVSARAVGEVAQTSVLEEQRRSVLGEPLTEEEVNELVERYRHSDCSRQINLGRSGVTHNMIDDIHNHWKRTEADKTGGSIIYRNINILLIYRGRNYDPENRPIIPLMLWKPLVPIYPRLVKNIAEGLTFEETKAIRNKGINHPPLMKLSRNGVYINVVHRVREAFKSVEVVRLDCAHVGSSDCKKIGVKLRDLVPCVPVLFKDEQIILWRGQSPQEQNV
ncbi:hypothetical protein HPP92_015933 [Vanilla planifolia]|uniref:CRM domain-containing protein n=1 Tax=Vanilla planifolia TaxID=51239 RepID=A0A835QPA9_VANPL|nr:hypothetical protein HPP92_015933 [Vanilla planifolia]